MNAEIPKMQKFDKKILQTFDIEEEVVIAVRSLRQSKNIPNKESIELQIKKNYKEEPDHTFDSVIKKLCNISQIKYVDEKPSAASTFIVKSTEFYVPLGGSVDVEAEINKLKEELNYTKGFLNSVSKKLSNERFVNNAPAAVVEKEQKKKADAEGKIKVIEEQIAALKK
jgi:valyl-tRNA synthetase